MLLTLVSHGHWFITETTVNSFRYLILQGEAIHRHSFYLAQYFQLLLIFYKLRWKILHTISEQNKYRTHPSIQIDLCWKVHYINTACLWTEIMVRSIWTGKSEFQSSKVKLFTKTPPEVKFPTGKSEKPLQSWPQNPRWLHPTSSEV